MSSGKSTTDWIARQQARKLRVDEAVRELDRSQKAMSESEKLRRAEKAKGVDTDMLFAAVRVGEENAETSIQIWKRVGMWAPVTIRDKLRRLAAEGRIERLTRSALKAGEAYCYYRKI
jgi:hypothetical protein